MAKKIKKSSFRFLADTGIIVLLIAAQVSFLTVWPEPISRINLVLTFIIFITVILSYRRALLWALVAGIILDMYSLRSFGILSVSLVTTVVFINLLFNHFFTNRSYLSLIVLSVAGTALFLLVFTLLDFLSSLLALSVLSSSFDRAFLSNASWQIGLNTVLAVVLFYAFNFISQRAKSVFLFSE